MRVSRRSSRYARQEALPEVGMHGQRRLAKGKVVIIGAGGTGCAAASALVRAGVGSVVIVDDDRIEIGNLHRQCLYSEHDLGKQKTDVAKRALSVMNRHVEVECLTIRADSKNLPGIINDAGVVIDCTDNMHTRHAINLVCLRMQIPWIYSGISGTEGAVIIFSSGHGPCLRCLFPTEILSNQKKEQTPVLGPLPVAVGSLAAILAIKVLLDKAEGFVGDMLYLNAWTGLAHTVRIKKRNSCPACGKIALTHMKKHVGKRRTHKIF